MEELMVEAGRILVIALLTVVAILSMVSVFLLLSDISMIAAWVVAALLAVGMGVLTWVLLRP